MALSSVKGKTNARFVFVPSKIKSKENRQIALYEIDQLFPFHFSINQELNVIEKGPSLSKILHTKEKYSQFSQLFNLISPKTALNPTIKELISICRKYVLIEMRGINGALLKGQFEYHPRSNKIKFWGSLTTADSIKLMKLGLSYADFPHYDSLFDIHQLKSLLTEVYETRLRAEEEQRDTISRDLHDGVGQMLAYLNIYFNILKEKSTIEISDIEKVQITLRKTIDEIRRISRNLAPPGIKQLGFKEAVLELINSYAIILKPAFHLKMYKIDDPVQFLYEHKIMIFRILQELSSNTFKYAKAKNVDIHIDISRKGMKLFYKDDGIGFDTRTTRKGIGLKSMLSRVEFYGGMIMINSEPNKGMSVEVNLPFD